MSTPGSGALANSKIMGLKFMQRRQGNQQASAQQAAVQPQQGSASQGPGRADDEWVLDGAGSTSAEAPAAGHVVLEQDALTATTDDDALLRFRSGRRSFGSFNPRLEKRLAEIRSSQRAAREAAVIAARAAVERREREAEHAALLAREEAAEAVEKESALEMASAFAAKYEKFVPAGSGKGRAAAGPPVVSNPVRVSDVAAAERRTKKTKR